MSSGLPDGRQRRRLVLLLVLVVVVLLGAGIGTFVSDAPDPSPPALTVTPADTPTERGPGGTPGTGTAGDNATPTAAPESPTATPTPNGTATATPDDERNDDRDDDPTDSGSDGSAGGGTGGSDGEPAVRLEAVGPTAILGYDDVTPGQSGREELRLRNDGAREGRLSVANVTVSDTENGIVGAEAAVDDTPDRGELSANVMVVLAVEYPDGRTDTLYGTGDGARSLRALADETEPAVADWLEPDTEATVTLDWYVPESAGNEIQSDGTEVDVTFGLQTE